MNVDLMCALAACMTAVHRKVLDVVLWDPVATGLVASHCFCQDTYDACDTAQRTAVLRLRCLVIR